MDGSPKPIRRRLTREERTQAISVVRRLLRESATGGDIKRAIARQFCVQPRTVERYLTAARQRNRQALGKTAEQFRADSLCYWSWRLQQAEWIEARQRETAQASYRALLDALSGLMDPGLSGNLDAASGTYEKASKLSARALRAGEKARDRIEGNDAARKVAVTSADGKPLPKPTGGACGGVEAGLDCWAERLGL